MKTFVLEVTPTVSSDGSTSTFLFGTHAWATAPTDTPASTSVRPFLQQPGTLRTTLFSRDAFGGAILPDYGVVKLADPAPSTTGANELSAWAGYGLSGSRVVLRWGELGDAYPAAFETVWIAYARKHQAGIGSMTIWLRDGMQDLEQPIITEGFALTGGLEGTAAVPKRKQFVSGEPGFIVPILVDRVRQIYYVASTATGGAHDLWTLGISGTVAPYDVFDNGVEISRALPNYTSEADILATTPSAGTVRFYYGPTSAYFPTWKNGPVYFRLGSPPAGDVRCYAVGYPTDADHARRGVALGSFFAGHLALRAGVSIERIDETAFATEIAIGSQWADDRESYADVLSDSARAFHGWFGFTRGDLFRSGYLLDPEDDGYYYGVDPSLFGSPPASDPSTSLYTFTEAQLGDLSREPVAGLEVPMWSAAVRAGRTAPSQMATGATSEMRDYLTREVWAAFSGISASTKLAEPGSEHLDIDFRGRHFVDSFASRLWLERFFVLFGGRHWFYTFTVPMSSELLALELHDVVTLQTRFFGLSSGRKHRIVGMLIDCNSKPPKITFTVWGGDKGSYTGTGGGGTGGGGGGGGEPIPDPATRVASLGDFTGAMYASVSTDGGAGGATTAASLGDFTGTMYASVSDDPYLASVILLMHMESGSPWADNSPLHATLTASGTITASTSSPLVGTASMVPGALGKVNTPNNATYNIGSGDLTVEWTMRLTGTPSTERVFEIGGAGIQCWFNGSTTAPTILAFGGSVFTASALSTSTTYKMSLVKSGTTYTLYADGTSIGSGTRAGSDDGTTNRTIAVGNQDSAGQPAVNCKIDEFRVTKGVARYSGSHTPPATPYPDG